MNFEGSLAFGKIGEDYIAQWIISRGGSVLPVYEIEKSTGKGPQLFTTNGGLVAPDMFVFNQNGLCWVEAKRKTVFSWYRAKGQWETGIDLRHYREYLKVRETTGLPVWLLFLHTESEPGNCDKGRHGCPATCPVGLFGEEILTLDKKNPRIGTEHASGMVYWSRSDLRFLASLDEVLNASAKQVAA